MRREPAVKGWRLSIRSRMMLAYGTVILVGFAILTALAANEISTAVRVEYDQSLRYQLQLAGQQLGAAVNGGNLDQMKPDALDQLLQRISAQLDGRLALYLPDDPRPGVPRFRLDRDSTGLPEVEAAIHGEISSARRPDAAGVDTLYIGSPVTYNGKPIIGVLQLAVPAQAVDAQVLRRWAALGLGFVILVSLALAAAFGLSRSITRPLFRLRESAERLGQGDLSHRVARPGADEIGDVSRAFNQMADELQSRLEEQRAFARNAAHELRTPLAALRLRTEALRYENLDAATAGRYIEESDDQVQALAHLVDELALLSRFDAGRAELGRDEIDLNRLASSLCVQLGPLARQHGVGLRFAPSSEPALVNAGLSHLTIVFRNLLDNSLKFTPAGGHITWDITLDDREVVCCIGDTGRGIGADDLPHVFQRFYRGDKARSRQVAGTGLGLSLVQAIVRAYGAQVSIASPGPDQGTQVTVQWPRSPAGSMQNTTLE